MFNVPDVIDDAAIEATLNVPNPTISTVSDALAPEANTTELPDVTVTSVPLTILTPFNTSTPAIS